MRTITILLMTVLMSPALLWGADPQPGDAAPQVLEIQVKGMTCPFCAYGIEKNLSKLPGVEKVEVSLEAKKVRVLMQPGQAPDEARVRQVIVDSGFTPGDAALLTHPVSP